MVSGGGGRECVSGFEGGEFLKLELRLRISTEPICGEIAAHLFLFRIHEGVLRADE